MQIITTWTYWHRSEMRQVAPIYPPSYLDSHKFLTQIHWLHWLHSMNQWEHNKKFFPNNFTIFILYTRKHRSHSTPVYSWDSFWPLLIDYHLRNKMGTGVLLLILPEFSRQSITTRVQIIYVYTYEYTWC